MGDRKEIATNRLLNLLREAEEKESAEQEKKETLASGDESNGKGENQTEPVTAEQQETHLDDEVDLPPEEVEEDVEITTPAEESDEEEISPDLLNYIFSEPSEVDKVQVHDESEPAGEDDEIDMEALDALETASTEEDLDSSDDMEDAEEDMVVTFETDNDESSEPLPLEDTQESAGKEIDFGEFNLDEESIRESVEDDRVESLDIDFEDFISPPEEEEQSPLEPEEVKDTDVDSPEPPEEELDFDLDSYEFESTSEEEAATESVPGDDVAEPDQSEEEAVKEPAEPDKSDETAETVSETATEEMTEKTDSGDADRPESEEGDAEFSLEEEFVADEDFEPSPGEEPDNFGVQVEEDEEDVGQEQPVLTDAPMGAESDKNVEAEVSVSTETSSQVKKATEPEQKKSWFGTALEKVKESGALDKIKTLLDLSDLRHITTLLPIQKTSIGIDISESSLKYIKITKGKVPTVNEYRYETFPASMIENPLERKQYVENVLSEVLNEDNLLQSFIHTTVISSEVSIQNISLPKVSKSELKTAVEWQSKKSLPINVDDAAIAYKIVGETEQSGVTKNDVLVVAALEKDIESQIRFWENFHLIPNKISLHPIATWNAYRTFAPKTDAETVMVVELGANSSFICVINKRNLRFVRKIGIADRDFTDALAGNISTGDGRVYVDLDMANRLKETYGFPKKDTQGNTDEGISFSQIASRMRVPLERLAKEIQRSYSYYQKEIADGKVSKIYLTGDVARIRNICDYLEEELRNTGGMDLFLDTFNPAEYVKLSGEIEADEEFKKSGPAFSVPLGLATDQSSLLNLLPGRLRDIPKFALAKVATLAVTAILVFSIGMTSLVTNMKISGSQARLDALQQQYSQVDPQRKAFLDAMEHKKRLEASLEQLKKQIQFASIDAKPLQTLSNVIPANFGVEHLDVKLGPNSNSLYFALSGNIYDRVTMTDIELIKFIQQLESTGYFNDITIDKTKKIDDPVQPGMYFELKFRTK